MDPCGSHVRSAVPGLRGHERVGCGCGGSCTADVGATILPTKGIGETMTRIRLSVCILLLAPSLCVAQDREDNHRSAPAIVVNGEQVSAGPFWSMLEAFSKAFDPGQDNVRWPLYAYDLTSLGLVFCAGHTPELSGSESSRTSLWNEGDIEWEDMSGDAFYQTGNFDMWYLPPVLRCKIRQSLVSRQQIQTRIRPRPGIPDKACSTETGDRVRRSVMTDRRATRGTTTRGNDALGRP